MSAVASIEVTGITELRARLTPERFVQVWQQALAEGLAPAVAGARALAPVRSGKLAGSIRVRVGSRRGSQLSAVIYAGTGYGHLVEYGHREVVGGRVARAGRFVRIGLRARFTGRVTGFVPPHPFAQPAFFAQEQAIGALLEQRLVAAIEGR